MSIENLYKANEKKLAVKTSNYQKVVAKQGSALTVQATTVPKSVMSDLTKKNSSLDLENPVKYIG